MIATTANCPSCGAPITFKVGSSITVVCEFCGSSIARTDRDLRNLGKVADLIDTQSPLRVGLEGRFDGKPFVLTGRVQIAHQMGGVWDEWYASFGDLGWGWLAEAQGRFTMTFVRPVPDPTQIPPVQQLGPNAPVVVPGDPTRWVVGETGVGRLVSGQGEIPYAVQPGLTYAYADLSGPNGAFATLDYRNGPPVVFAGRQVTLKDLGISAVVDELDAERRVVQAVRLSCPHCAAPVELRAPDSSMRVTCASCSALLDVNRGNLSYLKTLDPPRPQRFANGAEATVDGVRYTLVGYMVRGCQVEGEWYYWEEYLMYAPAVGYRWIVNGEGGWFWVEPVAPGDVEPATTNVRFANKRFTIKEGVDAVVAYVRGEFYWRVEVGERARAVDYVSRGETLSQEVSGSEVNWSFGRPIDPAAFDRAFDPRTGARNPVALPPARVVVPPKPLPSMWTALGIWLLLTVVAFGIYVVLSLGASSRVLLTQSGSFAAEATQTRPPQPAAEDSDSEVRWSSAQLEQTLVLGSFEITSRRDLEIELDVTQPTLGSDVYLKLVNDGSGQIRIQKIDNVYSGHADTVYESPGLGQYTLYAIRVAPEGSEASPYKVTVKEDVPDAAWPFFASFLLLGGPALLLVMKIFRAMFKE